MGKSQNKLAKRHAQRLERMLRDLDDKEARLQIRFGDRAAGSIRSSNFRDAEAIRAVLLYVAVSALEGGV